MDTMKHLKRFCYLILIGFVFFYSAASAHDIQIPVIVDTDAAFDDIRALSLLMNGGDVDVRLIVTSDGVLDPVSGKENLIRLISYFDKKDIPVVAGEDLSKDPPPFRRLNQKMNWSDSPEAPDKKETTGKAVPSMISEAVKNAGSSVLYICLGPMTNLAKAIQMDSTIKDRIYRVLYLGEAPDADNPGFNSNRDLEAAAAVFHSGISIYSFGLGEDHYLPFDMPWYQSLCEMKSPAGKLICTIHDDPDVRQRIESRHMRIWDEMTVIGLFMPEAFTFTPNPSLSNHMRVEKFDAPLVKQTYERLLGNPSDFHLETRNSVVLSSFPMDSSLFRDDVAGHVENIIRLYGEEEWKACLLTHELHRHLGINSLVGAKMGVRARELLEAPFDSLSVISKAGLKPPLSCMNDGLQVSTGASLGRGTIRVDESQPKHQAVFIYGDSRLVLTLKSAYRDRIKSDIKAALERFGGLGPAYFAHIRELSIRYWEEFDRQEIFEETVEPN